MAKEKTRSQKRRETLKEEFWPGEKTWFADNETGWFAAPRYLPLILSLLASKRLSGNQDPSRVYLELFSRHFDSGLVEMSDEREHAFAAGYEGPRAVRTWQERMRILEARGFIKTKAAGNHRYKYVLLIHPKAVARALHGTKLVDEAWWTTYRARLAELNESDTEFAGRSDDAERRRKRGNAKGRRSGGHP
jgi:hypothetical protein